MSVEQLKAGFTQLRQDVDEYYKTLAAPMTALDELSLRWSELATGSSHDPQAVADAFAQVRSGFQMSADGLINLSLAIDSFAAKF